MPELRATLLLGAWLASAPVSAGDALVDPTRPAGTPVATSAASDAAELVLSSILISEQRRVAVVNGRFARVGDRVGAHTIVAVEATHLLLRGPEGIVELRLAGPPAKRPPGERP